MLRRMFKYIPPGYGYLGDCREERGLLVLAGWLLMTDGPFDGFQAILPDGEVLPVAQIDRPELAKALPHVAGANAGGFRAEIPLPELQPTDVFEVQLIGLRGGIPTGSMAIGYHRSPPGQEYPPSDVMKRAAGNDSPLFWRATGIKSCNDFRRALAPHIDPAKVTRMLEWGCGSGRLTKHLIDVLPHVEVHGTDIDAEAIDWARTHLRGTFVPCEKEPPLPYADSFFDLVVCLSVLTHLTHAYQELWLPEIDRVLKPGGVFLATAKGAFGARWQMWQPGRFEQMTASGFNDETPDGALAHVASKDYYRGTLQTYEYTKEFWGKYFDVLDFIEGGINNLQDIYVMRKR